METARILVAMSNEDSINKLKALLLINGYDVVDQAREGNECLRKIRRLKPDLAVLDYDLSPANGFEIARIAAEDKLCDIILIMNFEQRNLTNNTQVGDDFTVVTKPLNRDSFLNTVNLIVKNRRKIMKLEMEIEELKKTLDSRKDIEKAKGLLMSHLGMTEEQAFKRIQRQSMDQGIPMKVIARAIILAYDI